jgi:hypothetical protein
VEQLGHATQGRDVLGTGEGLKVGLPETGRFVPAGGEGGRRGKLLLVSHEVLASWLAWLRRGVPASVGAARFDFLRTARLTWTPHAITSCELLRHLRQVAGLWDTLTPLPKTATGRESPPWLDGPPSPLTTTFVMNKVENLR